MNRWYQSDTGHSMNPDLVREQVMNTLESYRNTLADNRRVLFDRRFEVVDIALKVAGATLAAWTGASTKELMARLGHSTPRAALRYQHRDREMPTAWVSCSSRIRASPSESRAGLDPTARWRAETGPARAGEIAAIPGQDSRAGEGNRNPVLSLGS